MASDTFKEIRSAVALASKGDIAALERLRSGLDDEDYARIVRDVLNEMEPQSADLILLSLVRTGSEVAVDELSARYKALIDRIAFRFTPECAEIVDDLKQEGLLTFRYQAVPRYDREKGVPFRAYARLIIRNRMLVVCDKWSNSPIAQPLYRRIIRVIRRMRLDLNRDPTDLEVAQVVGLSAEDIRRILERREYSSAIRLDELDEADLPSTHSTDDDPISRELTRSYFDSIIEFLADNSGGDTDRQEGIRWVAVLVLKDFSEYTWNEVVDILKGDLKVAWSLMHEVYALPSSVPRDLEKIRFLFKARMFPLNPVNLRMWYHRRKVYLEHALNKTGLRNER